MAKQMKDCTQWLKSQKEAKQEEQVIRMAENFIKKFQEKHSNDTLEVLKKWSVK